MIKKLLLSSFIALSFSSQANFYIDLQKEKMPSQKPESIAGYKMLTGEYYGRVFQIGEPRGVGTITSEGDEQDIEDAMYFVLPSGWYAYIDEQVIELPKVTWAAKDSYFLDVLASIGKENGMKFVVDWNQSLVQIEVNEDFVKPNIDTPSVISDKDGKREVYIYTRPSKTAGYLLKNGNITPVTVE